MTSNANSPCMLGHRKNSVRGLLFASSLECSGGAKCLEHSPRLYALSFKVVLHFPSILRFVEN